jgi:hypothetical protein
LDRPGRRALHRRSLLVHLVDQLRQSGDHDRSFSNSFAGIAPADVAAFILAQLAGALAGSAVASWLFPDAPL